VHEYDTVLKSLLQNSQNSIFERITGARIGRWLNVELPEVLQTRVDLLGESADEPHDLKSVELQSQNDSLLPLRMAEYSLRVYRLHRRFPQQYVLYVGEAEMRMPTELVGPDFQFRYKIIDIRTVEEEDLLKSPFAADSIMAILTRHRDRRETIRRILESAKGAAARSQQRRQLARPLGGALDTAPVLRESFERIAKLEGGARDAAFSKLMILAGLRKLGDSIRTEVKQMPILDDIMDHDVIGPAIRQGLEQGLERGRQEEGLAILRRLIGKRFGVVPAWAEEPLANLSTAQIEDCSLSVLDAKSIGELFDQ
jgi:predicted transposase YdaD